MQITAFQCDLTGYMAHMKSGVLRGVRKNASLLCALVGEVYGLNLFDEEAIRKFLVEYAALLYGTEGRAAWSKAFKKAQILEQILDQILYFDFSDARYICAGCY
jgi:hypothetical protein